MVSRSAGGSGRRLPFVEIRHHRSRRLSAHPSRVVVLVATLATQRPASSLKARLRDQTEPARWLNHSRQAAFNVAQAAQAISQARHLLGPNDRTGPDPPALPDLPNAIGT